MTHDRPRLVVDIASDPVCPWCFVGMHAFFNIRKQLEAVYEVVVRLRAYQLNPDTPEGGLDRHAAYEKKFPDAEFRDQMRTRLMEAAQEAGAEFDPFLPTRLPNTLKAHRVLRWAHFEGRHEALASLLYDAYWLNGADLGDDEQLAQLAGEAGMNAQEVRRKLAAGEDADIVAQEAAELRTAGVTGVPTFIVNERTGFSGALPPKMLIDALVKAAAQAGPAH